MRSISRAEFLKRLNRVWPATLLSMPLPMAAAFGICATVSSVIAAYFEGRLGSFEYVAISSGRIITVLPFDRNFSTLSDFIVLDPFVIYFLQRSRIQARAVSSRLGVSFSFPKYHQIGLLALSIILGANFMKFYVQGSQSFDATMIPRGDGEWTITVAGWIVYSWTALYIAGLIFACIEHGSYVVRFLQVKGQAFPYAPFHPDQVAGIRFAMEPSLSFGYAMIGLLLTFVIFIVQDRVLYHIDSNRLLGFVVYILVAAPLLGLPFFHLHRLMKHRRDEYLFEAFDRVAIPRAAELDVFDHAKLREHFAAVESADKYRKIILSFPVWPLPVSLTVAPFGSIAAASFPLLEKLFSNAFPGVQLPGL